MMVGAWVKKVKGLREGKAGRVEVSSPPHSGQGGASVLPPWPGSCFIYANKPLV